MIGAGVIEIWGRDKEILKLIRYTNYFKLNELNVNMQSIFRVKLIWLSFPYIAAFLLGLKIMYILRSFIDYIKSK